MLYAFENGRPGETPLLPGRCGRALARARTPHPATVIMETLPCVMETLPCNVSTGAPPRFLYIPPSTFHLQTCNIRRTA